MKALKGAKHLTSIVFENCPKVKELELHPNAQLKKMQLVGNFSKESLLKTVRGQRDLGRFYLRDCNTLENLDLLQGCQTLEFLDVIGWSNLTQITSPDLEEIPSLRYLEVTRCDQLRSFEGIEKFKYITSLKIVRCPNLSDLSQLSELEGIRILEIDQCPKIKDAGFIRELKNLGNISRVCFTRTSISRESLQKLVAELGVNIICEGRSVMAAK